MPPRKHEARGQKFGRWTAISEAEKRGKSRVWNCLCDCGMGKEVWMESLLNGKSTSCGCYQKEQATKANTRHGMSASPEFRAWAKMLDRCQNPQNASYRHYGGRGISADPKWASSFELFLTDMGKRPSPKHSLERRDNNGNYEPGNCYWATRAQQARNTTRTKLITWNGQSLTLNEWSDLTGLKLETIRGRIRRGWSLDNAFGAEHGVEFLEDRKEREAAA